jgi:hypothetical protein
MVANKSCVRCDSNQARTGHMGLFILFLFSGAKRGLGSGTTNQTCLHNIKYNSVTTINTHLLTSSGCKVVRMSAPTSLSLDQPSRVETIVLQ